MKNGLSVILVLAILLSMMMIGSAAAEEVKITGAGCSPSTVGIGENVLFFVWTSLETKYIALFGEDGNQLCDWRADGHSVKDGQSRVWNVIVPTDTVGTNTVLVKASADGVNFTKEYKVSFTVTEDAPERISSGVPETTNVVKSLSRSIEPYEMFFVDVYTSDNAKVLALVGENGEVLQSWNAEESARYQKAGQCIWTVMLRPNASGELRYTFCASEDGVTYGNTMSTTVTVNALEASVYSEYLGTWYGVNMTEGGETYALAELGMDITLEINANGSVRMDMAGDVDETVWQTDNGCIVIEGAPLTLDGDTLTMRDYGSEMVFSREPVGGESVDLSGYPEYLGDWFCISMTEGGDTVNPAEYDMEVTLTLNADGTAVFDMAGDRKDIAWTVTEGGISLMTLQGTLQADDTLMISEEGTEMIFSREAPAETPTDEPTTGMPDPSAFPEYLGEWYCISMTECGETASPAEYGMAITLTLNADASGTLDMAGDVKDAGWSVIGDGISVMGLAGTLQADGTLVLKEEGTEMVFSREKPEGQQTDGGVDMSTYADYIGTWSSEADGMSVSILEDGTATVEVNGEITSGSLTEDYGYLYFGDTMLRMQYDGKLLWSDPDTDVFLARAGEGNEKEDDEAFDMTPYMDFIGMWGDGEIALTITEDGSAELVQNGETRALTVGEEYGYLKVDDLYLIMQSDGTLSVSGSIYAILYRDCIKPAPEPTPEPTPEPAIDIGSYLGTWYTCLLLDGSDAFAPEELEEIFGIMGDTITILEDGTLTLDLYGSPEEAEYTVREGKLWVEDDSLVIDANGRLLLSMDDDYPALLFERERSEYFLSRDAKQPARSIKDCMDKRFVCIGADMEGIRIDASMLGGEYAMTFHEDGRMDLVLAGMEIPGGCAWEAATVTDENGTEQTAFQIDYFGMTLTAVPTETGFEMNYMDSMLMHFALEEENQ